MNHHDNRSINLNLSYGDIRAFDDRLRAIEKGVADLLVLVASVVDENSDKAAAVVLAQTVRAKTEALRAAIVQPQP